MTRQFAVVILAAGSPSRQARPKQLLPYLGRTLVEHAARTALASGAVEIVVVAGADIDAIREKLKGLAVKVVRNRDWAEGMAASIRCGIGALGEDIQCAVIALCDQPKITPELLRSLAERHFETASPIVASSYDGVVGAPSAFGVDLFPSLMALTGNFGARDLIRHSTFTIATIAFSGGNVDIDETPVFRQPIRAIKEGPPRDASRETVDARGPPLRSLCSLSPA